MTPLSTYRRDQRGSSAVEFAIVVPLVVALVLGVIHLAFAMYSAVTLHFATEATARCLSVSLNSPSSATTLCPDQSKVQAYAQARYNGPYFIAPAFTVGASAACTNGKRVTGTGTYPIALGLVNVTIPITANACFPYIPYS